MNKTEKTLFGFFNFSINRNMTNSGSKACVCVFIYLALFILLTIRNVHKPQNNYLKIHSELQ